MRYSEFYLSYGITKEINSGVKLDEDSKFSNRLSKFQLVDEIYLNRFVVLLAFI